MRYRTIFFGSEGDFGYGDHDELSEVPDHKAEHIKPFSHATHGWLANDLTFQDVKWLTCADGQTQFVTTEIQDDGDLLPLDLFKHS